MHPYDWTDRVRRVWQGNMVSLATCINIRLSLRLVERICCYTISKVQLHLGQWTIKLFYTPYSLILEVAQ